MPYNYILKRSKRKTVSIKIENGEIYVYAPITANINQIENVLQEHSSWIQKKLDNPRINVCYNLENDEYIYVLGHKYKLVINIGVKSDMYIIDNELHLEGKSLSTIEKQFRQYLTATVNQQVKMIQRKTGIEFECEFKKFTSKWGCCYKDKKLIVMNIYCACLPYQLCQSVIYHEIAHLKVSNHQDEFYRYLEQLFPEYKTINKELKNYTVSKREAA